MSNNKGQALVEFILIIPVFMFILLSIIDVSNIVISKYKLENKLSTVVELYENNDTINLNNYIKTNNIEVDYVVNNSYTTIKVKDSVVIRTPGLNNILGKNMNITSSRTVYNE